MSQAPLQPKREKVSFLLLTGLLVGTLDILAAFLDYFIATGKGPEGVLRFIASGIFGGDAFQGSDSMMIWGLIFHYIIAFSFVLFFYWLYPRLPFMQNQPLLTGLLYGVFMWLVTTRIILPFSNTPEMKFHFWKALKAIGILILMIGLPLSYLTRKHFSR